MCIIVAMTGALVVINNIDASFVTNAFCLDHGETRRDESDEQSIGAQQTLPRLYGIIRHAMVMSHRHGKTTG